MEVYAVWGILAAAIYGAIFFLAKVFGRWRGGGGGYLGGCGGGMSGGGCGGRLWRRLWRRMRRLRRRRLRELEFETDLSTTGPWGAP